MGESASTQDSAEILRDLRKNLHEGKSFSSLIQGMPDLFPPIVAGLIRTGEEAGCLPAVMNDLRKFLAEQRDFKNFIVTSSIYPVIVACVTLAVVLLLFTVFIPQFAKVFEDMGAQLPALTRAMLSISSFLTGNWFFIPIIILLLILVKKRMSHQGLLRTWRDQIILKVPVAGPLVISVQISTFLQAMAIMTKSHVPLLSALKIAQDLLTNNVIRKSFESVSSKIQEGEKLSDVLGEIAFLPPGSAAMLKVAEESGDVGEMFDRLFQEQ